MRTLILMALGLCALTVQAEVQPIAGRHTIVGLLSMRKGSATRLFVNPMNRGRYTLNIQNPANVAQWMKRHEYSGLVRVEMDLYTPGDKHAPVRILKISPAHVRRVPVYDGNLVAVAGGNG